MKLKQLVILITFLVVANVEISAQPIANLDSGLVALWHFSDWNSTLVTDISGNGYDGNMYGSVSVSGKSFIGNCAEFEGDSNYIEIPNLGNSTFGANDFSFSFWFKTDLFNQSGALFDKGSVNNTDPSYGFDAEITASGGFANFGFKACGNCPKYNIYSQGFVNDNEWHHFVAYRKGNQISLFIDGALQDSLSFSGNPNLTPPLPLWIGRNHYGSTTVNGNPFEGFIDEFRIYDRYLNETEIALLAEKPKFKNEILYLNDNQVPFEWALTTLNSNTGIMNQRFQANITDSYGRLTKLAQMPDEVNILKIEFDGNLAFSSWGMGNGIDLVTNSNNLIQFYSTVANENYGDSTKAQIKYGGINLNLYDENIPNDFGTYHFTIMVKDNSVAYKAQKVLFNTVLFDTTVIPITPLIPSDIIGIKFGINTTTNNNAWVDNLQVSFGEEVDFAVESVNVSPILACPSAPMNVGLSVMNPSTSALDIKFEIDLQNDGIAEIDTTILAIPTGQSQITIPTNFPGNVVSSGYETVAVNAKILGEFFDTNLTNNTKTQNYMTNFLNDLEIVSLAFQTPPFVNDFTNLLVEVKNVGCNSISGIVEVDWENDGFVNNSTGSFANLQANETKVIEIETPNWKLSGNYDLFIESELTGFPDSNPSNNQILTNYNVVYCFPYPVFTDDFESGISNWVFTNTDPIVGWNIDATPDTVLGTEIPLQGQNCLNYNDGFNYVGSGANSGIATLDTILDLSSYSNACITFATLHDVENISAKDLRFVDISNDNFTNNILSTPLNNLKPVGLWSYEDLMIPTNFLDDSLYIRFRFETVDGSNNSGAGWFIDDFGIWGDIPILPTLTLGLGNPVQLGEGRLFNANGNEILGAMFSNDSQIGGSETMELLQLGGAIGGFPVVSVVEISNCTNLPYTVILNVDSLSFSNVNKISVTHKNDIIPSFVKIDSTSGNAQLRFEIDDCSPYFLQDEANFPLNPLFKKVINTATPVGNDIVLTWNSLPNIDFYAVYYDDSTAPLLSNYKNADYYEVVGKDTTWTHTNGVNSGTTFYIVTATFKNPKVDNLFSAKKNKDYKELSFSKSQKPITIFKSKQSTHKLSVNK